MKREMELEDTGDLLVYTWAFLRIAALPHPALYFSTVWSFIRIETMNRLQCTPPAWSDVCCTKFSTATQADKEPARVLGRRCTLYIFRISNYSRKEAWTTKLETNSTNHFIHVSHEKLYKYCPTKIGIILKRFRWLLFLSTFSLCFCILNTCRHSHLSLRVICYVHDYVT